jgi:hypothetical protein
MFPGGYGGIRGYVLVNWLVESFGDSSPGGKESREVPDVFPGGDGGGKGVHPLMNSFLGLLETNPLVEKNLEMLQISFLEYMEEKDSLFSCLVIWIHWGRILC